MNNQSGSARFRVRFESALQTYQQTTGLPLPEHPLAVQLRACHSVDCITSILEHEVQAFGDLLRTDRIMKSIESTVSMLFTLSATASFGDAVGLVRKKH
jgi:hypothetical protein